MTFTLTQAAEPPVAKDNLDSDDDELDNLVKTLAGIDI